MSVATMSRKLERAYLRYVTRNYEKKNSCNNALIIPTTERVPKSRVSFTEDGIQACFTTLKNEVMEVSILMTSLATHLESFNADEFNQGVCPKTGKVVVKKKLS